MHAGYRISYEQSQRLSAVPRSSANATRTALVTELLRYSLALRARRTKAEWPIVLKSATALALARTVPVTQAHCCCKRVPFASEQVGKLTMFNT
jgi:hypothetical protein